MHLLITYAFIDHVKVLLKRHMQSTSHLSNTVTGHLQKDDVPGTAFWAAFWAASWAAPGGRGELQVNETISKLQQVLARQLASLL
jgi:hypothetical protein